MILNLHLVLVVTVWVLGGEASSAFAHAGGKLRVRGSAAHKTAAEPDVLSQSQSTVAGASSVRAPQLPPITQECHGDQPCPPITVVVNTYTLSSQDSASKEANFVAKSPSQASKKVAKDSASEALVAEYKALTTEVHEEWDAWEGLAGNLGPKIESLDEASKGLKAVISSARMLQVPSVNGICANLTSCSACAASPVCGWCTSSLTCVPGMPEGPAEAGACGGQKVAYSFSACPGMACEVFTSCQLCTQQGTCGWCSSDNRCAEGSEWGPMDTKSPSKVVCAAKSPSWVHSDGQHKQC